MGDFFKFFKEGFCWIFSLKRDDPAEVGVIKAALRSATTFIVIAVVYWVVGQVLELLIPHPSFAYTVLKALEALAFYAALFIYLVRMICETIEAVLRRAPGEIC